jgi:hypothetical protein
MKNEECRITRRLTGNRLGLRWQSEAATPPSPARRQPEHSKPLARTKSGVALRFPPQSMTLSHNSEVPVGARISFLHSSFFILHSRVSV